MATTEQNSNPNSSFYDPRHKFQAISALNTLYKNFNAILIIIIIWYLQMHSDGTVLKAQPKHQKKIYNLIPYKDRKALVNLVITEGLSVYRASHVLGIKNTTAKAIMRRFRRQGTIFRRKHQVDNEDELTVKAEPEQYGDFKSDIKKEGKVEEEQEFQHGDVIKEQQEVERKGKREMAAWRNCGFYICYF